MIGAVISLSSMAVAGRAISVDLDTFELMMYRSFIGIGIVLVVGRLAGSLGQIKVRNLGLHGLRNAFHFFGQNLWFFSITVMPLAQVFALEFTMPLWIIVLSPIVLGEAITRHRAIAAAIGFIGILVVTRPAPDSFHIGMVTAAAAAFGFAGSAVFTRRLTRTETTTCILFYLTVMQGIFGLVCAGYDGDIALPQAASVPWIVVIAFAGLIAHFCLTTALGMVPASVAMPIDFMRLPLIAFVGYFMYQEPLDIYVGIGAVIIFAAIYYNISKENRVIAVP